jgi:hypothetical protein
MLTPNRVGVILILLLVTLLAAWSKLRFMDDNSFEAQRWRIDDHPRLQSQAPQKEQSHN